MEAGARRGRAASLRSPAAAFNDLLGETAQPLVLAVAKHRYGHVDRAPMMQHHHVHKIVVDVAGRRDFHTPHHRRHHRLVLAQEQGFIAGHRNADGATQRQKVRRKEGTLDLATGIEIGIAAIRTIAAKAATPFPVAP